MPTEIDGSPITDQDILEDADQPFELALPETVDERELLEGLYADLERGEHAKAVLAEAQAREIGRLHQRIGAHRSVEGMGQVVARVPLDTFLHWCARETGEFWYDQSSINYILRDNPSLVPETARKPMITKERELDGSLGVANRGTVTTEPASGAGLIRSGSARSSRKGRWGL